MNRTNLIWFAGGAATSALVAIGSQWLQHLEEPRSLELTISEPPYTQSSRDGPNDKPWRGAEIARDCGARTLEMVPALAADSTDYTRIPLGRANLPSVHCIIDEGAKADLWLDIDLEQNAQTH